jgi:hypothetical protein
VTTTLTIDDELFAKASRAMNSGDPNEVIARALRLALATDDSIELYSPERIAEFERAEKDLDELLRNKGLR